MRGDEEKDEIVARLNATHAGLGDALSNEREDLERVIHSADNPKEIVDALLPLTQLKDIQIGEIDGKNTASK